MSYNNDMIDEDEDDFIFDEEEYYCKIDIKPILNDVLKKDIRTDANIYDFFSFDEMIDFLDYEEDILGKDSDFTKLSEKERVLYKLCLDEVCRKHFDADIYGLQKAYLRMANIEANPYDIDYEEAVKLLRAYCREFTSRIGGVTTYISLFTYIDDIKNEEVLPYAVAGYLYEIEESVCALAEAYINHLDGMIIITDAVNDMIDKLLIECRDEFAKGDHTSALPYVCYEKYRILEKENQKDRYEERKSLLKEAKASMEKRIDEQEDRFMLVFDKHLLELIEECMEYM